MKFQWNAGRLIVMDYVGCARMVQVTPGGWSMQGIGRHVYGTFGYMDGHSKVPQSSRAKLKVDRELRTSGPMESGTTGLSRRER